MANGRTFPNARSAALYIIGLGMEVSAWEGGVTAKGQDGPYTVEFLDGTQTTVSDPKALMALASKISASPKTDPRYFAPPPEAIERSDLAQAAFDWHEQKGEGGTWTGPHPDTGMYTFTNTEGRVLASDVTERQLVKRTGHPADAFFEQWDNVASAIQTLEADGDTTVEFTDDGFNVISSDGSETMDVDDLVATAAGARGINGDGAAISNLPRPKAPFPPDEDWPPMKENLQTGLMEIDGAAVSRYYSDFGIEGQEGKFAGFTESEADARVAELGPGHEKSYIPNLDMWMVTPKEEAPFAGFTSSEADARLRELGPDYEKFYDSATNRFVVDLKPRRSLDEQFDDILAEAFRTGGTIDPGVIDRILALDSIRDQLNAERMTPERAFQLAAPIMQNPQHLSEMMSALLSDTGQELPQDAFGSLVTNYGGQTQEPAPVSPVTPRPNGLAAELGVTPLGAVGTEGDIGTQPPAPVTAATQQRNQLASQLRQAGFSEPEIASGVAGRQIPRELMSPTELASGAAGRVQQPVVRPGDVPSEARTLEFRYGRDDVPGIEYLGGRNGAINQESATQSTNVLAQLLNKFGLTSEQWDAMPFEQQIEAVGMDIADIQTGSFADYLRNPEKYRTQAGAALNYLYSQLPEGQQLTQRLIAGGPRTTLPSGQVVGPYDPQAARTTGVRTMEQENRLQQLLYQQEEAGKRGVGAPDVATQQIRQLGTMSAYRDPAVIGATPNALQASLGYGGQEGAFGGTPFFPAHQGRSARGVFQEKGARLWNEAQQRKFKASPVRRTAFR